jgi:hypothetical protein
MSCGQPRASYVNGEEGGKKEKRAERKKGTGFSSRNPTFAPPRGLEKDEEKMLSNKQEL